MAKLPRIFNRLFASQAGATEVGEFGSLALGSPTTTTSETAMQGLAPWVNGWNAAILGSSSPAIEDMNALHRVLSYQLGYLMQAGIAEWDPQTIYFIGSYCTEVSTGKLYRSIADNNVNNALSDPTKWFNMEENYVPAGTIIEFAGYVPPAGYLLCDGSAISRTVYSKLFAAIGDVNGQGDGSTTFNLPDTRGKFLRGVSGASGNDPDAASRTAINGGNAGNNVGSIQSDQYASHNHSIQVFANGALGDSISRQGDSTNPLPTGDTNVSGGNETRPKNLYVLMYIKY